MMGTPPGTGAFLFPHGMPLSPRPSPAPDPSPAGSERLRDLLAAGALAVLGLFAYSNALGGAFVFDDVRQVRDNPLVRDLANFLPGRYLGLPGRYVGYLTFALNYRLGGVAPAGYHLVNVLVHVANALLLFALVRLAFRTPRLRGSTLAPSSRAVAFVAAALFVAHPLQSQAVAYVVQRLTSLATTFYLAAVVLYAAWRLGDEATRPRRWRGIALGGAAVASAVLAMRTKEIAFTLPAAVALWELSFHDGPWRTRAVRLAPILATLPLVPLATLASRGGGGSGLAARLAASTRVDTPLPRLEYLTTQLVVVVRYLGLLAWPAGQNVDHDVPIHRSLLEPRVAASAALLAGLAALAAFLYRRTRPGAPRALDPAARLAGFGIAWFFLALLVESSLIPISDLMYEHRVYLPSVGLFAAFATALAALARRVPRVDPARSAVLGGTVLALVLGAVTLVRNEVWADDLSLWSDAALKSPEKLRPFVNLGTALALSGHRDLALRSLRRAVAIDPESVYARAQLATTLLASGRTVEAEGELRQVLRRDPRDPETLFNLATLLWTTQRRDEARGLYARFAEVAPPAYADARRVAAARAAPPGR